ncbi:ferredoxin [bacterium]|nr:MAG: ferredoxin [bacterium]
MDNQHKDLKKIITNDGKICYLKIDRPTCIGAGSCAALAPATFGLDEENLVYLKEDGTQYDSLEDVLAGAQSCPVFAIEVFDENMQRIWPE